MGVEESAKQDRKLIQESLALLSPRDRKKYAYASGLQMATGLLDLAGVLLFGLVGVLAVSAAQGTAPPATVAQFLGWVGLADVSIGTACLILALVAAALLISKSIAILLISFRVTHFLARCSAELSARLAADFFALPLVRIQKHTSQWSGFALSHGVSGAVVDVLNSGMVIRVEVALLGLLSAALLVVDPLTTIFAVAYFGAVVLALNRGLAGWARRSGETLSKTDVSAIATVYDGIATYREVAVANRRDFYVQRLAGMRRRGAHAYADQQFISLLPRYGMEVAMVLGAGVLVAVLLLTQTPQAAAGSLALFLTAASRVMPSLLRLNGARVTLHGLRGRAEFAYELAEYLAVCSAEDGLDSIGNSGSAESPVGVGVGAVAREPDRRSIAEPRLTIEANGLSIRYPDAPGYALSEASFALPTGGRLALVGPSGAGKTTLADAILGVVRPTRGSILIAGRPPSEIVRMFPGAIAYVPQDVALVSGTVRENVALGLDDAEIDDERVWEALQRAHLADFLSDSRDGLSTAIGERGAKLSGGQRQRLGIARALYSSPRLLVMDEATSALDAETENLITETLAELGDEVTTVTVAHRLATIRRADLVLYLEGGEVLARGSFEEVRSSMPRFDHQAQLLGL